MATSTRKPRTAKQKADINAESKAIQKAENSKPKPRGRKGHFPQSIDKTLTNTSNEDISRIIAESFQYFDRKPPKDNEELKERVNGYFYDCTSKGQLPTVEGLALACGVVRQTLFDWENQRRSVNPERADIIKRARQVLAEIDAKLASEGKIPQVVYIFRSKNFYGMRDQQEVVLTPNNPLGDEQNAEQLKQKYIDSTYTDKNEEDK
jgi:hypothetical protein